MQYYIKKRIVNFDFMLTLMYVYLFYLFFLTNQSIELALG